jgi:hypothetical protein
LRRRPASGIFRPESTRAVLSLAVLALGASARTGEAGPLYDRFCLACHGEAGDGRGPARPFVFPRPRDFTRGEFKWRTTASGQRPGDDDLERAIRHGAPGTSMHGFGATLDAGQIAALIAEIKRFAPARFARAAAALPVPEAPPIDAALIARGRALWQELGCAQCHGAGGRGDGPSAGGLRDAAGLANPAFDLTRAPLRRPRAPGEPALPGLYLTLATGLDGTAMPSYADAAPPADLWAVAAFVDSIRTRDAAPRERNAAPLPPAALAGDDSARYRVGYWPGAATSADAWPFGRTLALMGARPAALAPAQASPSAAQCGRCHAAQAAAWSGSIHARASSPGLLGQLLPMEASAKGAGGVEACQRCHAPLAEQLPWIRAAHVGGDEADERYRKNPRFDAALRDEGITCAACHVRDHRRFGPPRATDGRRLALPGYPLTELPIYERSDLCLPCHQLAPEKALAGRPLLDTYREWLDGPYMRRGVQCQHCHMPDREHSFKGIHDRDAFLQGIRLDAAATRDGRGAVTARARLWNAGAGHFLPTTPTPAVFLTVALLDDDGAPIAGATRTRRIGRHLAFERGGFRQVADTRIPPGESTELAAAWRGDAGEDARAARITIAVWPDEYYERFYRSLLKQATGVPRRMFEEALARTVASRYVALERVVPIAISVDRPATSR